MFFLMLTRFNNNFRVGKREIKYYYRVEETLFYNNGVLS